MLRKSQEKIEATPTPEVKETTSSTTAILATVSAPAPKAPVTHECSTSAPKIIAALSFLELLRGDYFGSSLLAITSAYYAIGAANQKMIADRGSQVASNIVSGGMSIYSWTSKQASHLTSSKQAPEKAPRFTN